MTSRMPGFHRKSLDERLERIVAHSDVEQGAVRHLWRGGGLPLSVGDRLTENLIAGHSLPLPVVLNLRVNGADVLAPTAVEEPSVVAAASNAARIVRLTGRFAGEATEAVMTAQIQPGEVPDAAGAEVKLAPRRSHEGRRA